MPAADEPTPAHDHGYPPAASFDVIFGPLSRDLDDYVNQIGSASEFNDETLRLLYEATGGRALIGQRVCETATELKVSLNAIGVEQFSVLSPPLQPPSNHHHRPSIGAALGLLELLSVLPDVNDFTTRLAYTALPEFLNLPTEALPTLEEVISELVIAGLLRLKEQTPYAYSIPILIRALMQRTNGEDEPGLGRAQSALRTSLHDTYPTVRNIHPGEIGAILTTAACLGAWPVLEVAWAAYSSNLFTLCLRPAVTAYLSLPDSVLQAHPILAVAQGHAENAEHVSRQRGSDDPVVVVPHLSVHHSANATPCPEASIGRDLTPEERAVLGLNIARAHRAHGDWTQALRHLRPLRQSGPETNALPPILVAELHYEYALNLGRTGQFAQSLTVLEQCIHGLEIDASDLPFPLQAARATAAQTCLLLGFHKRADQYLTQVRSGTGFLTAPTRLALTTVELYRHLDKLDLESSHHMIQQAQSETTGLDSTAALFLAEALNAVYAGRASLAVKDLMENHGQQQSWAEDQALLRDSSRINVLSFVCLAAGEIKPIQQLVEQLNPTVPGFALASARLNLSLGQTHEALKLIPRILAIDAGPRMRACAHALRAVCYRITGRDTEAMNEFVTALEYSAVASTLMPIAQLPRQHRAFFVDNSSDRSVWNHIASSFATPSLSAQTLRIRVKELPETLIVSEKKTEPMSSTELSFLYALEAGHSVARISSDSGLVEGTVKNKLSHLYKRLGVRNRDQAIEYARNHGYFSKMT